MPHSRPIKNKQQSNNSKSAVFRDVSSDIADQVINNPDFLKRINRELSVITQVTKMHSGPLPDPDTLIQYNKAHSDAADRIITMAENEQKNRHVRELKQQDLRELIVREGGSLKRRGQFFGFSAVLVVVLLAGFSLYCGHPTAAASIATGVIVSLAAVFVSDRKYKNKQNKEEVDNPLLP